MKSFRLAAARRRRGLLPQPAPQQLAALFQDRIGGVDQVAVDPPQLADDVEVPYVRFGRDVDEHAHEEIKMRA